MAEAIESKKNIKKDHVNMLDVVMFFRENMQKLNISFTQYTLITFLVSRNGINPEYAVNQQQLAKDLNTDIRHVRRLLQPLIALGLVDLTKRWRDNLYSISPNYYLVSDSANPKTTSITGHTEPVTNFVSGHLRPVITGHTEPVRSPDTIYRNRNKKIEYRSTQRSNQEPKTEVCENLDQSFLEHNMNNDTPVITNTSCEKSDQSVSDPIEPQPPPQKKQLQSSAAHLTRFEEFWQSYPKKIGKSDAMVVWRVRKYDAIADAIIADVGLRTENHVYWREKQYVPKAKDYLNREDWQDEIITGKETSNAAYQQLQQSNGGKKLSRTQESILLGEQMLAEWDTHH